MYFFLFSNDFLGTSELLAFQISQSTKTNYSNDSLIPTSFFLVFFDLRLTLPLEIPLVIQDKTVTIANGRKKPF